MDIFCGVGKMKLDRLGITAAHRKHNKETISSIHDGQLKRET